MEPGERKSLKLLSASVRSSLAGSERRFWLIVSLFTLGGAVLRILVHDFGLPWFVVIDELNLWKFAHDGRPRPYPPLVIWLHQLMQPLAEAQGRAFPLHAILDLRRLMLLLNVTGTVWFAMLGRRLGGAPAGIIAAALWAFETDILKVAVFATGDALAIPLLTLCVLLAVYALKAERYWWPAIAGMALGVLCFLCDYRLPGAVFPGFAALLWRTWLFFRPGWRRALSWSMVGAGVVAAASAIVIPRLPARLSPVAQATLSSHLWDVEGPLLILERTSEMIHDSTLTVVLVLIFLALHSRLTAATIPPSTPALLLLGATLLLIAWAGSAIRPYEDSLENIEPRHLLPMHLMFMLLLAAAVGQLLSIVQSTPVRRLMYALLAAYLLFSLVRPSLRLAQQYRTLPWAVIVRDWVDDHLASSTILVYDKSSGWFRSSEWGLPRQVSYDEWRVDDIRDFSLAALIETHHVTWALLPADEHDRLSHEPEGQALLEKMLLMRKFIAPPQRHGAGTVLYRLWRMQHETDVHFGDHIRLVGFDPPVTEVQPGDDLAFTLYWNATSTPPQNYSFFLHLVAVDDPGPLARLDGNPALDGRLTQTWDQSGETLISPRFTLTLPPDLAPGDYRILLGLYNVETGARLPVRDAQGVALGDSLDLMNLHIDGTHDDATAAD